MSSPTWNVKASIWEDSGLYLMARVKGNAGVNITVASISAITVYVYARDAGTLIATLTPTVSGVVFDTLQTTALDPRWTKDSVGYNFGYAIPAASFPTGGTAYRVEVIFDPASGDNFALVAEVNALALYSS